MVNTECLTMFNSNSDKRSRFRKIRDQDTKLGLGKKETQTNNFSEYHSIYAMYDFWGILLDYKCFTKFRVAFFDDFSKYRPILFLLIFIFKRLSQVLKKL